MIDHIIHYIKRNEHRIEKMTPSPIISRWINSSRMHESLRIINKHVQYLEKNGGTRKINQWFLSGDGNFNTITAERYILNYLKKQNPQIIDNVKAGGTDAWIKINNYPIGIEVTTLNEFLAEWILIERLTQALDEHGLLKNKGFRITYSHNRIKRAFQGGKIYEYIDDSIKKIIQANEMPISTKIINIDDKLV